MKRPLLGHELYFSSIVITPTRIRKGGPNRNPMRRRGVGWLFSKKHLQRSFNTRHDQVQIAIIVEIAYRKATSDPLFRTQGRVLLGDVDKLAIALIGKELITLTISFPKGLGIARKIG